MSNKLKELTWAHHQAAERRAFARDLIKGTIDPHKYYTFLVCQHYNYKALEDATEIPEDLEAIKRADLILEDIEELERMYNFERPTDLPQSVADYVSHIYDLEDEGDNEKLLAHMYTRHFGELHGGQIIKKKIPGSGKMYEFDVDKQYLIDEFRLLLHDGMADEAKICFDFASRLFDELSQEKD
jgi:heme oxygenase